jgi:hypothetical protein
VGESQTQTREEKVKQLIRSSGSIIKDMRSWEELSPEERARCAKIRAKLEQITKGVASRSSGRSSEDTDRKNTLQDQPPEDDSAPDAPAPEKGD